jgi:hypothetical protein
MADSDEEIYVDVIPRVDDSAADSAVSRLKDKFRDVAGDVGPEFMDALNNSGVLQQLGTKMGSVLSDAVTGPLKDLSEGVGLDLKNPLEKMLKQDMSGALDDLTGQLGTKLGSALKDPLSGIADSLGVDLGNSIDKALKGNFSGAAQQLAGDLGKKLGSVVGEQLSDLTGIDLHNPIGLMQGMTDTIKAFHGGDIHGGLSGAAGLLGNMHVPGTENGGLLSDILNGGGEGALLGGAIPGLGETGIPEAIGSVLGAGNALWNHLEALDKPTETHGDATAWSYMALGKPVPQNLYGAPAGTPGSAGGGGTMSANEVDVQSSVASVSAGSVTLAGGISLPSSMLSALSAAPSGSSAAAPRAAAVGGAGPKTSMTPPHAGSIHPDDMSALLGIPGHSTGTTGILSGGSPGYDNMIGILPSGSAVGLEGGEGVLNPKAMGMPGVPCRC